MRELVLLLPIMAFVALAAATAIVLRRAGRIVARTREVARDSSNNNAAPRLMPKPSASAFNMAERTSAGSIV